MGDAWRAATFPGPDEELGRVLRDPEVIASLDAIAEKRKNGTLVMYSHEEVRRRLKALGVHW